MLSPLTPDGQIRSYRVKVNGIELDKVSPLKSDWHSASLDCGSTVPLVKGNNTIAIVGTVPDVPMVEHVKLSKLSKDAVINDSFYSDFVKDCAWQDEYQLSSFGPIQDNIIKNDSIFEELTYYNLFNYAYKINAPIKYTFHNSKVFKAGDSIRIETKGIDGFRNVLNLFNEENPETYTWCGNSVNGVAKINTVAPVDGYYQILVHSYRDGEAGLCDVTINGVTLHNMVVAGTHIIAPQNSGIKYSSFVVGNSIDPVLWLEELAHGKVVAFNDDYTSESDYSWGYNPRITAEFSKSVRSAVVAARTSYNPVGTCDIYVGCKQGQVDSYSFPRLKAYDSMMAAGRTSDPDCPCKYNCFAWAGGLTVNWEPTFDDEKIDIGLFDNFFGSERYPGSPIYTRDGATENNSIIDLWGGLTTSGSTTINSYTHASVRKGGDANPHGYDWESKLGGGQRIFHPRYALTGPDYGKVVRHYRLVDDGSQTNTLEEAVADGRAVIASLSFDEDEMDYINDKVKNINVATLSNFVSLYDAWKTVWSNSVHSLSVIIADCDEYRALLAFCKSNQLLYPVIKCFSEGDLCAMKLIYDLTYSSRGDVYKRVLADNAASRYNSDGAMIIRSTETQFIAYLKQLIGYESNAIQNSENLIETYSNSDNVSVGVNERKITTSVSLDCDACVSIEILDKNGNTVSIPLTQAELGSGLHTYTSMLSQPGLYLVKVLVDGRWNVKKVIL